MNTENLKSLLNSNFVLFSYEKVNGEMRYAVGTRNYDMIEKIENSLALPTNGGRSHTNDTIKYFDLSRMGWRQFRVENFKQVYRVLTIEDALASAYLIALTFNDFTNNEFIELTKKLFGVDEQEMGEARTDLEEPNGNTNDILNVADTNYVANVKRAFMDSNARWCMKHNGGRGLNGVLLSAGGVVSSGLDCFGNPIGGGHSVSHSTNGEGIPAFIPESKHTESVSTPAHTERVVDTTPAKVVVETPTPAKVAEKAIDWEERKWELAKVAFGKWANGSFSQEDAKGLLKAVDTMIAEYRKTL